MQRFFIVAKEQENHFPNTYILKEVNGLDDLTHRPKKRHKKRRYKTAYLIELNKNLATLLHSTKIIPQNPEIVNLTPNLHKTFYIN